MIWKKNFKGFAGHLHLQFNMSTACFHGPLQGLIEFRWK